MNIDIKTGVSCLILIAFGTGAMPYLSYAQDDGFNLEAYINNEPDNEELKTVSEKEPVENPLLLEPATLGENGDALPSIDNKRLSVEDAGLTMDDVDGVRTPVSSLEIEKKSPAELEEEIRQEAFDAAITGLFPMKPDEIKKVLKQYDITTRAAEEPVNGIPTPTVSVETISLDPGVPPLVLKTATGHITTLNMLDATGAPWPIQDISWAGDFEVIEPEEGGHIIRITPMSLAAFGNMSIRLLTLQTPVTITLTTGKDEVQYRVDARIAEYGPQYTPQMIEGGSERVAGNDTIMAVLDGKPPQGARRLEVGGVDGRTTAYFLNNVTYVRTPLTLLSPGWQQSVSSADGMNVYALNSAPVLLLSDKGRFTRASIKTEKDPFDE